MRGGGTDFLSSPPPHSLSSSRSPQVLLFLFSRIKKNRRWVTCEKSTAQDVLSVVSHIYLNMSDSRPGIKWPKWCEWPGAVAKRVSIDGCPQLVFSSY